MKKRLMAVLTVLVLMPLVSWTATLHVGDEKFTPSEKTGYTYSFSSCAASASYSESKGFVLTFWGDSEVLGNISWSGGAGLNLKVGFGKLVVLLGAITSSGGGLLEINGPGTLRIINGKINPYSADVKLFGAVVEVTSRAGELAISTRGAVAVELSCLSIAGYGEVMHALDGFKFIASMISVLGQDYSSGDGIAHKAAIMDGSYQLAGGGISIEGCVLTILAQHHLEKAGLYTAKRLSVYDSVVTIASEGECFRAKGGSSFGNVLMLGVSRGSCSVYGSSSDDETRKAFFADGKYVFGAATAMPAIDAGYVEIDGGKLDVCAPDGGAVASYDFTMKDGTLKMVDSVDYSMVIKEMLAEGAVMGVISACSTPMEWTTLHTQILADMIMKLTAVVRDAPEGRAEAVVKTQRFCQTGGSIDQGTAQYGCAMTLTRATFLGTWYTPAFCGGSLKSDVHRYDSGVFDEKGYYDTAPTNALGQTLTRVEYEPYWVYLNGGVTPTVCKVVFNANGGQCSTTSRQIAKGAKAGTLPTATWDGYDFLGWYTAASGGSKVSESTVVTSDVTWYAHWQVKASTYTIQFDAGADGSWTTTANQRRSCKLNTVYALDMPNGLTGPSGKRLAGWRCSNGKRYDPGILFFNLAQAGKAATMTAIWESSTARIAREGGLYAVIDISGGTGAATYPISYLSAVPKGGWTDEYKTTKMVFRRIEPGSFVMKTWGSGSTVTLTKPFYMGVFEVTQRQYDLITGARPFELFIGDMRAANGLSYDIVRGRVNGAQWPESMSVDEGTIIDFLRKKTGLDTIDLPTEAEWEYACRAGTTTAFNDGTSKNPESIGRVVTNYDDGAGGYQYLTTVGSYPANNWGLYDMHGNIAELCLDWYGELSGVPVPDPKGFQSGTYRVMRGGSWATGRYGLDIGDLANSWIRLLVRPNDVVYRNRYKPEPSVGVGGDSGRKVDYLYEMAYYLPEIGIRLAIRELDVGE